MLQGITCRNYYYNKQNCLKYRDALNIHGLIGITIDEDEVVLIQLNESFSKAVSGATAAARGIVWFTYFGFRLL